MGKKVEITLTVDAATLFGLNNPNQDQVDAECSISDDNGGNSPTGKIEDFTSQVYLDNDVKWKGSTSDNGYSVAIDSIVYEPQSSDPNDVDFFTVTTINGSGGRSGNAMAKVKNDNSLNGKIDEYTINFSVYNQQGDSKSFHIDPKLAANP